MVVIGVAVLVLISSASLFLNLRFWLKSKAWPCKQGRRDPVTRRAFLLYQIPIWACLPHIQTSRLRVATSEPRISAEIEGLAL
jgi:hypothetical protein